MLMLIYSLNIAVFLDIIRYRVDLLQVIWCCISINHQPIALLFWVASRCLGSVDGSSHAPSHERGNPTTLDPVAILYQG
jgi:hypothetical protein